MISTFAFVVAGVASWFNPPAMYASNAAVCAWNVDHGNPVNIRIVNADNGKQATCRVIGSGPFHGGRVLDVSPIVAQELGFYERGTARVRVYRILPDVRVEKDCRRRACGVFLDLSRAHPRVNRPPPGQRGIL